MNFIINFQNNTKKTTRRKGEAAFLEFLKLSFRNGYSGNSTTFIFLIFLFAFVFNSLETAFALLTFVFNTLGFTFVFLALAFKFTRLELGLWKNVFLICCFF